MKYLIHNLTTDYSIALHDMMSLDSKLLTLVDTLSIFRLAHLTNFGEQIT